MSTTQDASPTTRQWWMSALVLTSLIAAGCTTTEQANEAMETRFLGTSVDDFFINYGPPMASHTLTDGRNIYLWAEKGGSVTLPSQTHGTVTMIGDTAWWNGWTSPGTTINVQCQVRIVASKIGEIERILAHSDSLGWWEMSRCHELFGRKRKAV